MSQASQTVVSVTENPSRTPSTFLEAIRNELAQRQRRNARYSLRSFARALALDASFLSKLLNGKRSLHPALIRRLGKSLGLSPKAIESYTDNPERWGTGAVRVRRPTRKARFESMPLPVFSQVADWYHFAILSLTQIPNLELDPVSISQRLGISPTQAKDTVFHLVANGFLIRDAKGKLVCPKNQTTVRHAFSTEKLMHLQKQYLEGAVEAMRTVPMEKRDQSGITMAIRQDAIPEAKECIRKFRRDLMERMEAKDDKDAVYQLCISFFPVESCQ